MNKKQILTIAATLIFIIIPGLYIYSNSFSGQESIEIELLKEPVAGETNTLQASSNEKDLKGETVYINGGNYGQLNSAGITRFNVPDTNRITIKVLDTSKTLKVQEKQEDIKVQGLNLESKPVQGQINRLVVIDEGKRVSGETVYLDGEKIGQTSNGGSIIFTIPEKDRFTLSTDSEDFEEKNFDTIERDE